MSKLLQNESESTELQKPSECKFHWPWKEVKDSKTFHRGLLTGTHFSILTRRKVSKNSFRDHLAVCLDSPTIPQEELLQRKWSISDVSDLCSLDTV
ncbi:hypothetical protein TNCV_4742221 [Trichonephila clavipes]|nr:hypothetical protein TNCV_4742221 [Trichonephila clavipes]